MTRPQHQNLWGCALRWLIRSLALVALLTLTGCGDAPGPQKAASPAPTAVRIALSKEAKSTLALVAWKHQLFEQYGLAVEASWHPSGKLALQALLDGQADIAMATTIPVVFAAQRSDRPRILASLSTVRDTYRIVARTDRGIARGSDLVGKRIATQQASAVHYFLYLYLLDQGLHPEQCQLTFLPIVTLPAALVRGDIDAFCARDPFVAQALTAAEQQGIELTQFKAPYLFDSTMLLLAGAEWLAANPEAAVNLMRALAAAETFCLNQPQQAQQMVAELLEIPPATLASYWPSIDLHLGLSQSLLVTLEQQYLWACQQPGSNSHEAEFPFLRWMAPTPLRRVAPHQVTLIEDGCQ
ncbi:ABC transporter substrate-binding protein [Desulfuromonas thiophila]|uniref:NMT1-like family protein n=1 Tax=Desulfuromonas thiophila TaxID=57664 RepID=A0A1G7AE48_9BACT|nr:NrtA/SsuA/CpmA family ABC transporter substrate-binding protein [Desulfuromonas thiophila]SDE13218.1 NMT1-like family protein [Desulfuromonas thiophila]